jgi:hypothetical protein
MDETKRLDPISTAACLLALAWVLPVSAEETADPHAAAIAFFERASAALGAKFDVREFHDLILRTGGVPLKALEAEVLRFIDARKG